MTQPAQISDEVSQFVSRIDGAVSRLEPEAICEGVKQALQAVAADNAGGIPDEFFAESSERYARRLLHRCPRGTYSIMVMVWGPGQGTPVHDHAGKWCVECVMKGRIAIDSYDYEGDPQSDDVVRLRLDETIDAGVGEVGILVPPNEYHAIRNPTDESAVTVHVYAGEMLWCHKFEPRDGGGFTRTKLDLKYSD